MKILFLITQDFQSPAGYGRYFPIARELHKLGHHVEIAGLHPQYSSLKERTFKVDGVKIHHVAPMHVMKSKYMKSYYPGWKLLMISIRATFAFSLTALRMDPEIIHIGKPHPMNSMAALMSNMILKSRLVLDIDDYEEASGRFSSPAQQRVVSWFERKMPSLVELVTTNTRFSQGRLISSGIPNDRIVYIPNGVDKSRFEHIAKSKTNPLIQSLGLRGKKIVAYIGSLSRPSHAVDLLLPALGIILESDPSVHLLLVGGGEAIPDLRAEANRMGINKHVLFTGWVSPEDIPEYYAIADVCIDPVMDDDAARGRSPLKLFESWASGTPFVTGDVGDRRELMGTPAASVLVEPGNSESLAQGVMQILTDTDTAKKFRNLGLLRADDYNWVHITEKLVST